jgi:hypothetical protein
VSVYDAAATMGVTVDAIRKRIARGTIPYERDEDGRVWVLVDTDQGVVSNVQDTDQPQSTTSALISEMHARVESLERQLEQEREANRENRRLLAAALERIPPQLEASQEGSPQEAPPGPRGSPETARAPPYRRDPQRRSMAHRRPRSPGPGGGGCSGDSPGPTGGGGSERSDAVKKCRPADALSRIGPR